MNNPVPSLTSPVSSRTLLALTEAVEHTFDASAWAALGLELDMPQLGDPESRLQESLRLRDDDYGYFVAQFLRHLQDERPGAVRDIAGLARVKAWLDANTPDAVLELGLGQCPAPPLLTSVPASQALEQALKDAAHLLGASGADACVEQVDAALRGYLRDLCARAGVSVADGATAAQLFESVRAGYPQFVALDQHDPQVGNALASLAEAITALDRSRSYATIPGQSQVVLKEAEAMLAVDLVRTLFNYLRARPLV